MLYKNVLENKNTNKTTEIVKISQVESNHVYKSKLLIIATRAVSNEKQFKKINSHSKSK